MLAWVVASVVSSFQSVDPIDPAPFSGQCKLSTDVFEGRWGSWAICEIEAGPVLAESDEISGFGRGDVLTVEGEISGLPGSAAGHTYRAALDVRTVSEVEESDFLPHRIGRLIRSTVMERLEPPMDSRALLAGFLIGETSNVSPLDVDAMRRSGLAHFVAVSGSNVALFLSLLFVCAGPLAMGAKRRAMVGLVGLPIYAAATLFEPSVMRASVMAGIALTGRLLDVVLEAWQLLSLAVIALLLFDPGLTSNLGFQLSVAATAGVLVGARWPASNVVMRAMYITLGAQVAVAPLLITTFGTVPLMSPLVNVLAGPIVAASTVVGAVGVAGIEPLITPGSWLAGLVLSLARGAAAWPQVGPVGLGVGILGAFLFVRVRSLRPMLVVAVAGGLVSTVLSLGSRLEEGEVVVLDVGQGDAILLSGGEGHYALVDGGPDPALLTRKLDAYGIRHLDLVVLTHVHADHASGLTGVVGRFPIGEMWMDLEPHESTASTALVDEMSALGLTPRAPGRGDGFNLGSLRLRVMGPIRRYASPNDQSLVIMVEGPKRSMLLSGDIETFAQEDLAHLRANVLKVPHQGAATSDLGWLASIGAQTAVVSVGPNQFGHPSDLVISTLIDSGAVVRRTDEIGDVIVDLS